MQKFYTAHRLSTRTSFYLLSALILWTSCAEKGKETKDRTSSNAIPVRIASIETTNTNHTVEATGLISTKNQSFLSFKIGGMIENVLVEEGQAIKKGQLLATLKTTEIDAEVQQVKLAVEKAERDHRRITNLYKDSVATLEQLENSKTGLDIARENLQKVLFNRKYANIYASANGFIVKKLHHAGEVIAPGAPVLAMNELDAKSTWILTAGVADREWAQIDLGNKATVSIDAFPNTFFDAIVTKKSRAADAGSGSFEIELELNIKAQQPAVGMFGKATISLTKTNNGYAIPYEALLEANGNKGFVFVTDDRKTVQKIEVTIASIESNHVLIEDGLRGHAFVVISGSPYLTQGAAIQITP